MQQRHPKMKEISLLPLPDNIELPKLMHGETIREQVRVMIEKESHAYYSLGGKHHQREEQRRGRQELSPGTNTGTATGGNKCGSPLTDKEALKSAVKDQLFAKGGWRQDEDAAPPASSSSKQEQQEQKEEHEDDYPPSLIPEEDVDAIYRLKMSQWSYRIIDYFGVSREIIAIAFDYLDRFIDSGIFSW